MRTRPSKLLDLRKWVEEHFGLDGWWTCYQFDSAVTWTGRFIEARLHEYDDRTKKQRYTLDQLLEEPVQMTPQEFAEKYKGLSGAVQIIKKK
jgi:hypothetical protein